MNAEREGKTSRCTDEWDACGRMEYKEFLQWMCEGEVGNL